MTHRYAALLRAVNVGGRKLAMADLRRIAADCGFAAPSTLLASGNLVFETPLAPAAASEVLRLAILGALDLATDVFVRDAGQIQAVLAGNPFVEAASAEPSRLAAMFLDRQPQASLDVLASACGMGEQLRLGPGCLYIWTPQGIGDSKLSGSLIERRLGVRATGRNWNTVGKLATALAVG